METYYDVLGVKSHASTSEIKSAYKNLVKIYHPDINSTDDAQEKMKEINTAYEVISDPHLRKLYDIALHQGINSSIKPTIDPEKIRERKEQKIRKQKEDSRKNKIIAAKVVASALVLALILSGGIYWIRNNFVSPAPITDLSRRDLNKIPYGLEGSTVVNILYLHENNLKNIPSFIGSMPNLMQLTLSRNDLVDLPSEIGNLNKLISLDVSDNKLSTLPPEIGQLNRLSELYLSENPIISLPVKEMSNMTQLKLLDVRGCKIPINELLYLQNNKPDLMIRTE